MSAKTVGLDREAYEMLGGVRCPGETFSDAVEHLSGSRTSVLEYSGIRKDILMREMDRIRAFLRVGRR